MGQSYMTPSPFLPCDFWYEGKRGTFLGVVGDVKVLRAEKEIWNGWDCYFRKEGRINSTG